MSYRQRPVSKSLLYYSSLIAINSGFQIAVWNDRFLKISAYNLFKNYKNSKIKN